MDAFIAAVEPSVGQCASLPTSRQLLKTFLLSASFPGIIFDNPWPTLTSLVDPEVILLLGPL